MKPVQYVGPRKFCPCVGMKFSFTHWTNNAYYIISKIDDEGKVWLDYYDHNGKVTEDFISTGVASFIRWNDKGELIYEYPPEVVEPPIPHGGYWR
jgi:hypothetical protein